MKKKSKKQKQKKPKQLTSAKREEVRTKAQAMVDVALGVAPAANGHSKKKITFPGAEELADATWNLKRVLNKYAQNIYTKVLSETIIRLQHAKRKNIV